MIIIYTPEFLDHQTGKYHPESPQRLTAIVEELKSAPWSNQISWELPTPVSQRANLISLIEQIHHPEYVQRVKKIASNGGGMIDPDTIVSPRTYDVALLAVSAWLDGIDRVISNQPTFVMARPPGHHAIAPTGMGFCIFGNAAIAAHYGLQQPQIQRVGILDWDVHHGNGTQELVQNNPLIAYCSIHQSPCYPGTGKVTERGQYNNVLNLPLPPHSTIDDYLPLFTEQILPFFHGFNPDLLIISAGYDAHRDDPLAEMSLNSSDYGKLVETSLQISSKILFGLEGGYDLVGLPQSIAATIAPLIRQ
jgi:acetoin utilization deacetylase AcuC-like enzyme